MAKSQRAIAQEAVDFAVASTHFDQAAESLGTALKLMKTQGKTVSYGESIRESIKLWAEEAADLETQALDEIKSAR